MIALSSSSAGTVRYFELRLRSSDGILAGGIRTILPLQNKKVRYLLHTFQNGSCVPDKGPCVEGDIGIVG